MPNRCGFELLRRLALEYSLRSRSEAVALRTSLASRSYLATSAESSQATLVADSIRKLELELSRYNRLLATLPSGFSSGLGVNEGDLVSLLLRSLPDKAREHALHFSGTDTYAGMRAASLRWEQQYRMVSELRVSGGSGIRELQYFDMAGTDEDGCWLNWEEVNALQSTKCQKSGKGDETSQCSTDMSRVRCFRCGEMGHISVKCQKGKSSGKSTPSGGGSPKGQSKGKGSGRAKGLKGKGAKGKFAKGSGNGKGKGKKGRTQGKGKMHEMHEVTWDGDAQVETFWYDADGDVDEWAAEWWGDAESHAAVSEAGTREGQGEAPLEMSPLLVSSFLDGNEKGWWLLDSVCCTRREVDFASCFQPETVRKFPCCSWVRSSRSPR